MASLKNASILFYIQLFLPIVVFSGSVIHPSGRRPPILVFLYLSYRHEKLELRAGGIITSSYSREGKCSAALESSVVMVFGEMNITVKYSTGHRRIRPSS
jgi:hypothetical protein